MIKFKFVSNGIIAQERRKWLNKKCQALPLPFMLDDIKPGTFSSSIMKRLRSAQKDGMIIDLRKGIGYQIGIQVINKEDRQDVKNDIANLKRKITRLAKSDDVKDYITSLRKLIIMSNWRYSVSFCSMNGIVIK
jgi:hypothetical protein